MRRAGPRCGRVLLSAAALIGLGVLSTAPAFTLRGPRQPVALGAASQPPQRAPVPGRPASGPETKGRIRGSVVAADTNAPLRDALVRLAGRDGGESRTTTTDADGRFEFLAVPGGRYVVSASKVAYLTREQGQRVDHVPGRPLELTDGQALPAVTIVLPRGGVIAGRIIDQYGEPLPDARVRVLRHQRRGGRHRLVPAGRAATTDDLGQFRVYGLEPGEYFVGATPGETDDGETVRGGRQGHATSYYPGTTSLADAQVTPVVVAQEAIADFPLVPAHLVTVSGVVVTSSGRPAVGGRVELRPRSDLTWGAGLPSRFTGGIGSDGGFTLGPVAPGTYVIVAEAESHRPHGSFGPFLLAHEREVGTAPVTVGPDPLRGATVATAPGGVLSGKVETDAGGPSGSSDQLRVTATPVDADDPEADLRQIAVATVRADRSFELRGLRGRYLPVVLGLPAAMSVKAVVLGTRDVTDVGIEVASLARVSGVRIVITSRVTELSGAIHDRDGRPVRDYVVLAFSADRSKWTHPQLRYTRIARPDQQGRYAVTGLPPGEYSVVALENLEAGTSDDPEVLARLEASASRVRLIEGEARVLDLDLTRQ